LLENVKTETDILTMQGILRVDFTAMRRSITGFTD
jgi:hypothetical protein